MNTYLPSLNGTETKLSAASFFLLKANELLVYFGLIILQWEAASSSWMKK